MRSASSTSYSPSETPDDGRAGELAGNWRIEHAIGRGGMGTVYQAVHRYIGRRAAVKLLHPAIAADPHYVSRFLNEARAVNLVASPGIVEIYEFGLREGGQPYLVMELLEGESLDARRRRGGGRLLHEAPRIGGQIARALAAVHEKGIVHRDLKPANVMLVRDAGGGEQAKVFDFGIARLDEAALDPTLDGAAPRTRAGVQMGTPEYMAPEQCRDAARVDGRADVYALGVMLYELLAGERPFSSELAVEVMTRHVREPPRPLLSLAPEAGPELAALVHAMLTKHPHERPSMREVAERLASAPLPARRPNDAAGAPAVAQPGERPTAESTTGSAAPSPLGRPSARRPTGRVAVVAAALAASVAAAAVAVTPGRWRHPRRADPPSVETTAPTRRIAGAVTLPPPSPPAAPPPAAQVGSTLRPPSPAVAAPGPASSPPVHRRAARPPRPSSPPPPPPAEAPGSPLPRFEDKTPLAPP